MKKWLKIISWVSFGVFVVSIWALALRTENQKKIENPKISIHVEGENAFLTKYELMERLKFRRLICANQGNQNLDIRQIETAISSMAEVKKVSVFKNIGKNWFLKVDLRKPIARIFNVFQQSFYIDEDGFLINRSNLHTARVLIVSGFIYDKFSRKSATEIINNDSLKSIRKIDEIYRISNYVCNDTLMSKLIGQVYLKKNGDFVLIPLVGDQKILFGSANSAKEIEEKFNRLMIFYSEAIPYEGWNKYEEISVKYEGQIVCRKRK